MAIKEPESETADLNCNSCFPETNFYSKNKTVYVTFGNHSDKIIFYEARPDARNLIKTQTKLLQLLNIAIHAT